MHIGRPQRALTQALLIGAGVVLSSAVLVRYLTYKAEKAHRPMGGTVNVGGHSVHVRDQGEGQCVVLLHGNGSMMEDFASTQLIEGLVKKYRVLTFDRPGFGLTPRETGAWSPEREAELLAETLRVLNVRSPVLVAHSWATLVALNLALRNPNSLRGLVLLSGYYFPTARVDVVLQTPAHLPLIGNVLRNTFLPLLSRMMASSTFKTLFSPRPVPTNFKKMFSVPMASRPSQLKSVADDTVGMPGFAGDISVHYHDIQVPIRIVAGAEDKIVTSEQSRKLHHALPNSTLDVLPDVGHMSHHADPELVIRLIDELSSPARPVPDVAAAKTRAIG